MIEQLHQEYREHFETQSLKDTTFTSRKSTVKTAAHADLTIKPSKQESQVDLFDTKSVGNLSKTSAKSLRQDRNLFKRVKDEISNKELAAAPVAEQPIVDQSDPNKNKNAVMGLINALEQGNTN